MSVSHSHRLRASSDSFHAHLVPARPIDSDPVQLFPVLSKWTRLERLQFLSRLEALSAIAHDPRQPAAVRAAAAAATGHLDALFHSRHQSRRL